MTRDEVIKRFCKLVSKVQDKHLGWQSAADCFCDGCPGIADDTGAFDFEGDALLFIEAAVEEKLFAVNQNQPNDTLKKALHDIVNEVLKEQGS